MPPRPTPFPMSSLSSYLLQLPVAIALLAPAIGSAHSHHPHEHGDREHAREHRHHPSQPAKGEAQWWKGNLHTHTLWSDGSDFPEMVADWYRKNGYNFLALSDHNVLSEGAKWVNPRTDRFFRGRGEETVREYIERFGERWVEAREIDEEFREELVAMPMRPGHMARRPADDDLELGATLVRLKPLSEFRHFFEEPGKFLLIQSEEISAAHTIHVNATNLIELIEPLRGETPRETMELNVDAVYDQRERTGQSMFPHVNHPNFRWALTAEDMAPVENLVFFEVYNGHPQVLNDGDELRIGLERFWDIILTQRLAEFDLGLVYGLAVDDAHEYHTDGSHRHAAPGRGWVMVRSPFLTPEHIVTAMERGEFYASTGVTLRNISSDGNSLEVEIEPEEGVTYVTQFIGTRTGYDPTSEPVVDEEGEEIRTTRRYSAEIGEVLAEENGPRARYEFSGDEIYVRAKVISSKPKENPYHPDEKHEVAWVQPVVPNP